MENVYLSRQEAAAYLTERGFKTSPKTLAKLACVGGGPIYRVYSRRAVYLPEDLDQWAATRLSPPRRSTSDIDSNAA